MKLKSVKINLFVFIGLIVLGFSFLSFAQENSQSNSNVFLDTDQDGLSNDEEKTYGTDPNKADTDGDGYSDGTEIRGGYDPLKPAPGDKLPSATNSASYIEKNASLSSTNALPDSEQSGNLTENVSDKVLELINEKSTKNEPINIDDLDLIINQSTSQTSVDSLPEIDRSKIKIKKQNYEKLSESERLAKEKNDTVEYLTTVSYILLNNAPKKLSTENDINDVANEFTGNIEQLSGDLTNISYFESMISKGDSVLDQLYELEVPKNMLEDHVKGIQIFVYAKSLKDEMKTTVSTDPLATIATLSKVKNLLDLSVEFSQNIAQNLTTLGISDIPVQLQK